MRKILVLLCAAGMLLGASTGALAVDFKAKGQWVFGFDYGQHGNFTSGSSKNTGYNSRTDEFSPSQRVRLQMDAVASESLSGTVYFEIGDQTWGKASQGAALGADGNVVELKNAYLDWIVPQTDAKFRMGIQNFSLPSFTTASQIISADVAAIAGSYQLNDNVGLTAVWARPYNDNYSGFPNGYRSNYMDNVDLFALSVPLNFDGVKVTPWAMYGMFGPNAFRTSATSYIPAQTSNYYLAGLYPLYGTSHNQKLTGYGNAVWGGFTGDVSAFAPFRLAWDFNYGSITRDDASSNRAGWLADALAEYAMDWGIPGIHAWYSSGDDDNPGNGSERLPYTNLDEGGAGSFGTFAFNGGRPNTFRDSTIAHNMGGTWGIGLYARNISFIDKLTHTVRVNYIGGTNDPALLKKLAARTGEWLAPNATVLGKEGLYMTRNDGAIEFNLNNEFKMYDNFTVCFDIAYIKLMMDQSRTVWGQSKMNNRSDAMYDAWNVNVNFIYSF